MATKFVQVLIEADLDPNQTADEFAAEVHDWITRNLYDARVIILAEPIRVITTAGGQ